MDVINLVFLFFAFAIFTMTSLLLFLFFKMRRNFWDNRHIVIKNPTNTVDLTPRFLDEKRFKPKFVSDEKLFEFEQNPAKH